MKNLFATSFVLLSAVVPQAEGAYSPAKAELKPVKGVPCVFVNDEMLPPMSFTGWWMHLMEDGYLSSLGRANLRIHYIYSWTRWLKPVDRRRRVNMYSLCSEKWWARADEAIEDFYRELAKYPEFSSVIGTFLCSAGTCEWYYPCIFRNPKTKATGDCSAPFLRQYRRYLKETFVKDVEPKIPSFDEFDYIGDEAEKIKTALCGGKPYVRGANPAAFGDFLDANNAPHVMRETVVEPPPGWTGLIERPRAGHGEEDGQMYILWGAEMSPDFDHYELYRDGKFLANVTNEVPDGIPYRVARYEDTGLPTHSRHEYRLRKVWKDGRKDELGEPFYGVTRYMSDEERNGIGCEGEYGRMYVRYDGATVESWKPEALKGRDVFFMQKNAPWGKEVHGGLPICWPWFGKREGCPKHGLARYLKWRFAWRFGKDSVLLETESSSDTMKIWPHPFKLRALLSVDGPDALTIKFTETNTGEQPYESAFGIHPYFAVADACEVALDGERLPRPWVIKDFAADGKAHELQDCAGRFSYSVMSSGNDTWCVWNPGVERTPLCGTLGPDEWRRFYCLEPFMRQPITLAPGESREHVVRIAVSGL